MTALAQRLYPAAVADGLFGSSVSAPASSEKQGGTTPAPPPSREISPLWNAVVFRRSFPEQWGEYLRLTYRTAYAVQRAFPGIDSRTARDWIKGRRDPSGSFVAKAIAEDPAAIAILARGAA